MKQTLKNQTKHITTLSQNIHLALEIIRSLLKYVDWEGIKMVFFSFEALQLIFLIQRVSIFEQETNSHLCGYF